LEKYGTNCPKEGNVLELPMKIDRKDIHITGTYSIYDLLKKQEVGTTGQVLKCEISGHDVVIFKLKKQTK
jgi:hypothetical protein